MKKLIFTLLLSLIYCSFASANIIFENCSLEPNYGSDAIFTIDIDQQIIKVKDTYDFEERTRTFNIKKLYGNIITSSNITNSSDIPSGGIEFLSQYVIDEVIFDLAKKRRASVTRFRVIVPFVGGNYPPKHSAQGLRRTVHICQSKVLQTQRPTH